MDIIIRANKEQFQRGADGMCEALLELVKDDIEKEIEKGKAEETARGIKVLVTTCRELGVSFEETAAKLKEKYFLEDAEVQKDMKLYW